MKTLHTIVRVAFLVYVFAYAALAQPNANQASHTPGQSPIVRKIEPPNWWINYTPDLTLLLTGENFAGANVAGHTKGLQIASADASADGHYLFIHLKISMSHPETAALKIENGSGFTVIHLPLLARADPTGHFEGFSRDDVIYLIMPDRFADGDPSNDKPAGSTAIYDRNQPMAYHGGDLKGVREHLKYLHDLGVTTVWLTPVWKNTNSDYHGYHVVDFYALDDHMGSMEEYQALVADAHKLGMKVLIDYIVNHTGPNHPWANDPPTPTWLHGTPANHLEPSYDFSGLVDPHAPPREYLNTLNGWFAGKLPDLNPDDAELATYLVQNAEWWIEMAQLDGIRLDTFPYSSRRFWQGWHQRLRAVYKQIDDIGEVFDHDPAVTSFFEGGQARFDGIDSGVTTVFDFPLEFAIRDVILKSQPLSKIVDVLRSDALYPHPEMLVTFIGNHDNRRFMGEEGASPAKLKAAFSLLLTLRGIPQIYSGDEIAMQGGGDPDNRRDFPGGFPGDPQNAFESSGRTPEEQDVFAHVQSLLALRKLHPALRMGKQWHVGWDDNYYAFVRELPQEKLLIIYNNATSNRELHIPVSGTSLESAKGLEPLFGGAMTQISNGELRVTAPPLSLAIFAVR